MTLDDLKGLDLYLATPYTKYPHGIERAFEDACRLCGELLRRGVTSYSPIAHTHPVAMNSGLDPLDHSIWLPFDRIRMDKADAILVATMAGWSESFGIAHEIDVFEEAGKPVYYLDPVFLEGSDTPVFLSDVYKEKEI